VAEAWFVQVWGGVAVVASVLDLVFCSWPSAGVCGRGCACRRRRGDGLVLPAVLFLLLPANASVVVIVVLLHL
jgi:hypothetical protein